MAWLFVNELVNIRDLLDCELCENGVVFGLFRSKPYLEKWRNGPKQVTGLSFNMWITVGGK